MNPRDANDQELRRLHFRAKLAAEAELMAAVRQVERGEGDFVLLDVRDAAAYAAGHLPGAVSLPLDEIPARAETLDRERQYVAYCWRATCLLAARAALQLAERGFEVRELNAGWREWTSFGYPIATGVEPPG